MATNDSGKLEKRGISWIKISKPRPCCGCSPCVLVGLSLTAMTVAWVARAVVEREVRLAGELLFMVVRPPAAAGGRMRQAELRAARADAPVVQKLVTAAPEGRLRVKVAIALEGRVVSSAEALVAVDFRAERVMALAASKGASAAFTMSATPMSPGWGLARRWI